MAVRKRRRENAEKYFHFARLVSEPPSRQLLEWMGGEELGQQAEAIAREYAALFLVPGAQKLSPYESIYCDETVVDGSSASSPYFQSKCSDLKMSGYLGGYSVSNVKQVYRKNGFEVDAAFPDLPDHLGVELEFLGRLTQAGRREEAEKFYQDHLRRWIFRFLEDLESHPEADFYRTWARALQLFLAEEHHADSYAKKD